MKKEAFLKDLKNRKLYLKNLGMKMVVSRMVWDNISDIIPDDWQMEIKEWNQGILIKPVNEKIGVDVFDKEVSKFARRIGAEPDINISEEAMVAHWNLYPGYGYKAKKVMQNEYLASVVVEFVVGNTEKCEITYKRKMHKVPVLTGYCKAIAEKKFLTTVNN